MLNAEKLKARGFEQFGPGWFVKLYKQGDTQHGVAVLFTDRGPAVLQAAESVPAQVPEAIAGAWDELVGIGAELGDIDNDVVADVLRQWHEDDELATYDVDQGYIEEEEDALDPLDYSLDVSGPFDDPFDLDFEVGSRKARRQAKRQRIRARRQTRRDASPFRKKVHKAASKLARGKVMRKLRELKVKVLQSPLADAATGMAARALQAFGVPPQVAKMALNTAREAGIDRAKQGGWAGMVQRATAKGAKPGTFLREGAQRQLKALKGGAAKSFGGGALGQVVQSFASSQQQGSGTRRSAKAVKRAQRAGAVLRNVLQRGG